ncbi:MAG TPA: phosphotransferase [Dehalococcoidia bacterium]|nr:phosphotransferase [Dehalococcoidia bacterium]
MQEDGRTTPTFPVASSVLAPSALRGWASAHLVDGPFAVCRLFRTGMNDTYLLHGASQPSMLRVYRHGWRSVEEIGYELDLLRWLAASGISVALPIAARDGRDVHLLSAPEGVRPTVHFRYAPGSAPPGDDRHAARLGSALADLHRAGDSFRSAHQRFRLDLDTLLWHPLTILTQALGHRPADTAFLAGLATWLSQRLATLAPRLDTGPIHGDVYPGNTHITPEGGLTWFDFDLCGDGWRAYDLAVFRMNVRLSTWPDIWPAFLRAYRERRALTSTDIQAIPLLVAVRDLWHLGFHLGNVIAGRECWWLDEAYLDRRLRAMRSWATLELGLPESTA